jgi:4-diphosphocytidyl-2-C-methyl-D-erythritol kinase
MNPHGIVDLRSPAKINLFLSVTGRRPDGYHNLETLMCPVALFDRIRIQFEGRSIRVRCGHPGVPSDETNLVCRAVNALRSALKGSPAALPDGMALHIDKSIPVGAGLGGGSSNAASVLMALNRYLGDPIPPLELNRIGASIGADVPFFLQPGPAIARGIGEQLEAYRGLPPMTAVIVYPGFGVSTADTFGRLSLTLTKCQKKLRKSLFNKNPFDLRTHLCNDLESVTMAEHPAIGAAKEALVSWGADGALMSGSGSAVYGLFKDSGAAQVARVRIDANHPEWQVFEAALMVERHWSPNG